MLYIESYINLCDRSTLQLLKCIEIYEECWRTLNRENTLERRQILGVIKKAYRNQKNIQGYARMTLFGEGRSILIRRSTPFLACWMKKCTMVVTK